MLVDLDISKWTFSLVDDDLWRIERIYVCHNLAVPLEYHQATATVLFKRFIPLLGLELYPIIYGDNPDVAVHFRFQSCHAQASAVLSQENM